MDTDTTILDVLERDLDQAVLQRVERTADAIVTAKRSGGKVVVVTGSGPNIHEGVTTLVAELMRVGVVDGVSTSSAVVAHEMGGVLEQVKRVDGRAAGLPDWLLPLGGVFELTLLDDEIVDEIGRQMVLDAELIATLGNLPGDVIIKAAGNLSYPMGLWIERLAAEVASRARCRETTFELAAGEAADARTMIGQGARRGIPVLVTVPQLVGGGGVVGLAIGDTISITQRSALNWRAMLASADVIIESAVALTQEVHDGPLETHTGHGLWAAWQGVPTYSLEGKSLVRIDLDPTLEKSWLMQRQDTAVQAAIDGGLPKTKVLKVPFRMEMSGFARLAGSIPLTGDIGVIWPLLRAA